MCTAKEQEDTAPTFQAQYEFFFVLQNLFTLL
jgi:hypothetical protein